MVPALNRARSPVATVSAVRGSKYDQIEVERLVKTVHGDRLFLFRNKFVKSGSGVDEQFLIC